MNFAKVSNLNDHSVALFHVGGHFYELITPVMVFILLFHTNMATIKKVYWLQHYLPGREQNMLLSCIMGGAVSSVLGAWYILESWRQDISGPPPSLMIPFLKLASCKSPKLWQHNTIALEFQIKIKHWWLFSFCWICFVYSPKWFVKRSTVSNNNKP